MAIHEIGPQVADSVADFFQSKENRELIQRLRDAGVKMEPIQSAETEKILKGKILVFTGALQTMTRKEAQELTENLGGRAAGSVSKSTDFVVVGDNPGSKADKARDLGIEIISELEFRDMVGAYE